MQLLATLTAVAAILLTSARAGTLADVTPETYGREMDRALALVNAKLRGSPRPLAVGVNLTFAHEAWVETCPTPVLVAAVDAVAAAGVRRIDLNVGAYPWLDNDRETIAKYDAVVRRVREHGLALHINPQYSPVRHRFSSLAEWERAARRFYPGVAARYRPDTFVVVHEPTTIASRLGAETRPAAWAGFAARLARLVKATSPDSRIGAGGLPSEEAFFRAFAALDEIEVLTIDIYSVKGIGGANELIRVARRANKPVYIEETGRPPYAPGMADASLDQRAMRNVGNAAFADVDIEWARTLCAYASTQHLEGVTFFWAHILFGYSNTGGHANDPAYNRMVMHNALRGERTETYRVLAELTRLYAPAGAD